jgi:hypothetical protein
MSPSGNGQSSPFQVELSPQTKTLLLSLHQEAMQAGKGQAFREAFRRIVEQLRPDARNFDEPFFRLPAMRLEVRQGVKLPLEVVFGVHEEQQLVFIRGFKLLS